MPPIAPLTNSDKLNESQPHYKTGFDRPVSGLRIRHMEPVTDEQIDAALVGAPEGITPESMRDTLITFQPLYTGRLTAEDALEILMNVRGIFGVLSDISKQKPNTLC